MIGTPGEGEEASGEGEEASGESGEAPGENVRPDISVRARFERFPATVKGAFVIRGEDANPHQVGFREARVVRIGGGFAAPIAMKEVILHAPPHQDVFLPFEFPTTDLAPGWYGLVADMDVDGASRAFPGERLFGVAWPRASARRGTVSIDEKVDLEGGPSVHLQGLECAGDHVWLRYAVDPAVPVTIRLIADGEILGQLESEFEPDDGRGRLKVYPLLRAHRTVGIEVTPGSGSPLPADQQRIEVRLP